MFKILLFIFFNYVCSLKTKSYLPRIVKNSVFVESKNECKYSIILFPGFGKSGISYFNLCNKVNEKLNNSASFLYLDFGATSPFKLEQDANIIGKECVEFVKSKNKDVKEIYFMGHSVGAYYAIEPAEKYGDGFIQMGNVLNSKGDLFWRKKSLKNYEKKILTLLGEKDGYLNYLNCVQEFQDINDDDLKIKPIVIEKNVNHLQMADNIETSYARLIKKNDLLSTLTLKQAHENIANTISSFIQNTTEVHFKTNKTKEIINNYLNLHTNLEELSGNVQKMVLGARDLDIFKTTNIIHENFFEFVYSKPKFLVNGNIETHSYLSKTFKNGLYSKSLCIKMKNQQAFLNQSRYSNCKLNSEISSKEINREIFDAQFLEMCPINVIYEEEVFTSDTFGGSLKWLESEISVKYDEKSGNIRIKSPVFISNNFFLERYDGMKYMKLLSPQMASEIKSLYYNE